MENHTIYTQPLTKNGFEKFGEVIECEGNESFTINDGYAERFHNLALAQTDDKVGVSIFRAKPRDEIIIDMMERHPFGSQAFMPLQNKPWVVVVAEDKDGKPEPPIAFLASGKQGVNYRQNIWHYPLISLETSGEWIVVDRHGEGHNINTMIYKKSFKIEINNK